MSGSGITNGNAAHGESSIAQLKRKVTAISYNPIGKRTRISDTTLINNLIVDDVQVNNVTVNDLVVSDTFMGEPAAYFDGVTSNIQAQLNAIVVGIPVIDTPIAATDNNGIVAITGGVSDHLAMEFADATHNGIVSTTTQSFTGNKTIIGDTPDSSTVLTLKDMGVGPNTCVLDLFAPSSTEQALMRFKSSAGAPIGGIFADSTKTYIYNGSTRASPSISLSRTPVVTTTIIDTTASTSTTTGALVVNGGVGIAGSAFIGGGLRSDVLNSLDNSVSLILHTGTSNRVYDGSGVAQIYAEGTTGFVGVGVTSPTVKLDVLGDGLFKSPAATDLNFSLDTTSANSDTCLLLKEAGVEKWRIRNQGDNDDRLRVGSATNPTCFTCNKEGFFGIGTNFPADLFEVSGSAGASSRLTRSVATAVSGDNLGQLNFYNAATRAALISGTADGATDSGRIEIWTTPTGGSLTQRATFSSNGNLGINKTAPEYYLDINSDGSTKHLIRAVRQSTERGIIMTAGGQTFFKTAETSGYGYQFNSEVGNPSTSGVGRGFMQIKGDIAPTSGTADFTSVVIDNVINQTGGANGVTRGVKISPTLTSAADYRSIELEANSSTAYGIYQSGSSSKNYFAGNVGLGIAAPTYTLDITSTVSEGSLRVRSTQANIPTIVLGETDVANVDWQLQNRSGDLRFRDGVGLDVITFEKGGNVGIGNTNPATLLDLGLAGTTRGVLRLAGTTSGNVTIQAPATGTWTLTLPADDGTANQYLQTNGSGISVWATQAISQNSDYLTGSVSITPAFTGTLGATGSLTASVTMNYVQLGKFICWSLRTEIVVNVETIGGVTGNVTLQMPTSSPNLSALFPTTTSVSQTVSTGNTGNATLDTAGLMTIRRTQTGGFVNDSANKTINTFTLQYVLA